jgi:hypothetical protein
VNVDLFFSRPLTAKSIFYSPHGEYQFFIRLTANVDFIFLTPLHGVDQFSLRLMARTDFIPTRCFVPHGGNQCSLSLTARLGFILIRT